MTMGLKIRRMIREDGSDHPDLKEEAERRKEVSDSVLEVIYGLIVDKKYKGKKQKKGCEDEDG